jgi:outer membrane scaffolding protein for murein synthesis (MipA/OmpV family)
MNKYISTKLATLVACVMGISSAFAVSADEQQNQSDDWQFKAGIGAFAAHQPWKEAGNMVSPFPALSVSKGRWTFFSEGLVNYSLWNEGPLTLSLGLDYRDEGYGAENLTKASSSDNIVFDGYKTPEGDVTFDIKAGWNHWFVEVHQDISGNSEGMSNKFGFQYPVYTNKRNFNLSASAFINWQNRNYVQHIYGISGDQVDVAKGRTTYTPNAATNFGFGISGQYMINERWSSMLGAEYLKLDDAITESPLVGRNSVSKVFAMAIYSF